MILRHGLDVAILRTAVCSTLATRKVKRPCGLFSQSGIFNIGRRPFLWPDPRSLPHLRTRAQ